MPSNKRRNSARGVVIKDKLSLENNQNNSENSLSLVLIDEFLFFQFLNIDPMEINTPNLEVKNCISFNKHTFVLLLINAILLQSCSHTLTTHPISAVISLYLIRRFYLLFYRNSISFDMGFKFLTLGFLLLMFLLTVLNIFAIYHLFGEMIFALEIVVLILCASFSVLLVCWFFVKFARVLFSKKMMMDAGNKKKVEGTSGGKKRSL